MRPVVVKPGEGHRVGNVEFLARSADTPRFNLAVIEIQPHRGGPPIHAHAAEDDAFYILEGELTFTVEDEVVVAGSGHVRARPAGPTSTHSQTRATRSCGWSTSTRRPASTCASKATEPPRESFSRTTQDRPRRRRLLSYSHGMATFDANAPAYGNGERILLSRRQSLAWPRPGSGAVVVAGFVANALPLFGFVALLVSSQLDPELHYLQPHFVLFRVAAGRRSSSACGRRGGEPAGGRARAAVSLAFLAIGGFLGLHAIGTPGILFTESYAGFKVAIPVGLMVSACFAAGSAFVDLRPQFAPPLIDTAGVCWARS